MTSKSAKKAAGQQAQGVGGPGARQILLMVMAVGIVTMVAASFIYRMSHPSMTVQAGQRQHTAADHEEGGEESPMVMIRSLMAELEKNPNDVHVLHTLGEQFMRMRAWDRAKALFDRALAVEPSNLQVLRMYGIVEFNLQKYPEAAEKFEMVIAVEPHDYMSHYNLGVLYGHFMNDTAKAKEHLKIVAEAEDAPEQTRIEARSEMERLDAK
ncbi:cytochrome c-type biogenesis protein CcmH/NrfG [Desulfobaculum xiamenense]|uniref:Cytochrome c-type biogenesis protein CcmH/NrfG n=1 Tax=Desulfobaculum xiamenense TaxID=995050 RepID=A0A846QF48_9BACT|nr:tetratricopeptide repeat protein [Desulfobaculum xiamenense]NJB67396.1 cytochrome c-type biogenesis protein CcmH/NrfG [Desulfobaculum xiamenense]